MTALVHVRFELDARALVYPLSCAGAALASSAGPRVTGTTEQRQRYGESVITEVLLVYSQ